MRLLALLTLCVFTQGGGVWAGELPPVSVTLIPHGSVFRSFAEYEQTILADAKSQTAPIHSAEFEIRRLDEKAQVARLPFFYQFGHNLDDQRPMRLEGYSDGFSREELRRMGELPPGEYAMAFYLNGVRASNVVGIKIDPKAVVPTFQLGLIEAAPLAKRGQPILWVVGPTPADKRITNFSLASAKVGVDGIEHQPQVLRWSGSIGLIANGQRSWVLLGSSEYIPPVDLDQPHQYSFEFAGHRAEPLEVNPTDQTLGKAWDLATPRLSKPPRPIPLLRGKVTDQSGKPAVGYGVSLGTSSQGLAQELSDLQGGYEFVSVPPGQYRVSARPLPPQGSPFVSEKVILESGKTVEMDLTFEKRYSISGRVLNPSGQGMPDVSVSATWEDPKSTTESVSQTRSNARGDFSLSGPFSRVSFVGISSADWHARPHHEVKPGETSVNFIVTPSDEAIVEPPAQPSAQAAIPYIDLDKVAAQLGKGLDVNLRAQDGNTPLAMAARTGRFELVKRLVEAGTDVNAVTGKNYTVLRHAIGGRSRPLVAYLLEHGADPNLTFGSEAETPLMEATRMGHLELAELLIAKGAKIQTQSASGSDALSDAAKRGSPELIELLVEQGADVNRRTQDSMTPLMIAARSGHARAVEALLKHGAEVSAVNEDGFTALFLASGGTAKERDYLGVVEQLLTHGANPSPWNLTGQTPLIFAASQGSPEVIQALAKGGADLQSHGGEGTLAMLEAIRLKKYNALAELLRLGASPDAMVKPNCSALFYAIEYRADPQAVEILIQANANLNATKVEPENEYSPLIAAARRDNKAIVRLLVKAGANLQFKDDQGKTAKDYALSAKNPELLRLLSSPSEQRAK